MRGRLGTYLRLGRVSNLPTVWTNVLAGIALGGGALEGAAVVGVGLGASSAYVGGMFLNDAFDRHIDARERPERPIPSGAIASGEVFGVGALLLAVAVALIVGTARVVAPTRVLAAGGAAVALVFFIVLYDAWHKQNPLSPVVMGLCRGSVYASAALASGGTLSPPLLAGAVALTLYVVGLTAVARQEHRGRLRGKGPLVLVASPLLVVAAGEAHAAALLASGAFAVWIVLALAPSYRRQDADVPRSVVRLIAGISLVDGMMGAAYAGAAFAVFGVGGLIATLGTQRWVRGT
jgi:4-hydroxybenzoate polyprenyltransferase